MTKQKFIIIGGGIMGMTTARELALSGHSVALFDKGELGMESSWAAGGILSSMRPWSEPEYSAQLSNQGKKLYPEFSSSLYEQTGIDPEYQESGLLMINQSDIDGTRRWAAKNKIVYSDNYKIPANNINIPSENIFLRKIAQVRVPRLLKALYESLKLLNVDIYENTPVTEIKLDKNQCSYIKAGNEKYYADNFCITTGAWLNQFTEIPEDTLKITPVLGQMLCVKFTGPILETMILDGGNYLIPRKDGHVLIGSTMENTGYDQKLTESAKKELTQWAINLWPDIEKATFIKHWAGLRPSSEDGQPFIGQYKNYDNLYINTGHFRKGILQAPPSAKIIAELMN